MLTSRERRSGLQGCKKKKKLRSVLWGSQRDLSPERTPMKARLLAHYQKGFLSGRERNREERLNSPLSCVLNDIKGGGARGLLGRDG